MKKIFLLLPLVLLSTPVFSQDRYNPYSIIQPDRTLPPNIYGGRPPVNSNNLMTAEQRRQLYLRDQQLYQRDLRQAEMEYNRLRIQRELRRHSR